MGTFGKQHPGGPRSVYTPECYERLLRAFSIHGSNITAAAKTAGVNRVVAQKAWERGWLGIPWAKPIHLVLGFGNLDSEIVAKEDKLKGLDREALIRAFRQSMSEYPEEVLAADPDSAASQMARASAEADALLAQAEAALADAEAKKKELEEAQAQVEKTIHQRLAQTDRAVQERLAQVEVRSEELLKERMAQAEAEAKARFANLMDKARIDAAEVMADEAASTKFGRKAAVGAAAMAAIVLQEAQAMAQQVREAMKSLKDLSPKEAIRIVRDLVVLAKEAQKVVIYALQAERLRVGKPTEVVGIEYTEHSLAEQEIQLEAMRIALEERKEMEARAQRMAEESLNGDSGSIMASGKATLN